MLASIVRDSRDLPILRLIAKLLALMVPCTVLLFAHFHLAFAIPYAVVVFFVWSAPFSGLIHEVSHRPLFSRRWQPLGRACVEFLLCPLFGLSPWMYGAQHVGMHHPENNLAGDASATIGYQRDSAVDFARYFARFLFLSQWEVLWYLHRKRKTRLFRRAAVGLAFQFAAIAAGLALDWRAALVALVIPFGWVRLTFAAGNWAQHGFVDPQDPANSYRNTITCVTPGFNRVTFNSGYHIGHHADLKVHWSDLPVELERERDRYRAEQAVVFEGIDYGHVFFALMFKRHRWLAERHADFGDDRAVIAQRLEQRVKRLPQSQEERR